MEWSLRNKESSELNSEKWLSPLVGDHNRVCRDMIVVVEVITGRLMRDALKRQGCQLVTINVREEQGST